MMNNTRNRKILLLVTLFFWYAQYVYVPYQTPYLSGLGIAMTMIGVILGAYGFSQMAIRIPLGVISDRNPRHKMFIALGAVCAGLASIIRAASPTDTAFLVANLISGFASATYISFTVLNASYYEPGEMQKAMGTISAFNNAGILIAFVTGMVVSEAIGIQPLFYMSSAAGFIGFAISLFIREERKPVPKIKLGELLSVVKKRTLIIFAVLALILQMVHMSTAMSFTTQVAKDIGGSNVEIGLISIVYMALSIVSSYFVGTAVAKKIGNRTLLVIAFACITLYCILVPQCTQLFPLYFLQAMCGFAYGAVFSVCMSGSMTGIPKEKRSTAMGFFQAVYGVGMTIGPMIAGAVRDTSGMPASYYFLILVSVPGIVISIAAFSKFFRKDNAEA